MFEQNLLAIDLIVVEIFRLDQSGGQTDTAIHRAASTVKKQEEMSRNLKFSGFGIQEMQKTSLQQIGPCMAYSPSPPNYESAPKTDMAGYQHTRVFLSCFHLLTNAWNHYGNYSKNSSPPLPSSPTPSSNPALAGLNQESTRCHSLWSVFFLEGFCTLPGSLI